jgi:hypothetical protein
MNSRCLQLLAAGLIAVAPVLGPAAANGSLFHLTWTQEATIADIRAALAARDLTCRQLVQGYIDRIEAYDKKGPQQLIGVGRRCLPRFQAVYVVCGHIVGPQGVVPIYCEELEFLGIVCD